MNVTKTFFTSALLLSLATSLSTGYAKNLLEVYHVSKTNDTTLQQAHAVLQSTQYQHRQSRAALLPQADFSIETSHSEQEIGNDSSSNSDWGYTLSITQSIYDKSNYDSLSQTDKLLAKSEADYKAAQQNLIIRVAEAYFDVLAAQDNLNFSESETEANARQLEQTKQRFEVGLIAITDVHEAQAAHDLALARKIVAQNDLSSAKEALRELTGQYYDSFQGVGENIPLEKPEPFDADTWADAALENNLRIISSQLALASTRAEVKKQQSGHLPKLDLIGRHNYRDDAGDTFGGESITDTSITLQLSVPLYQGGATSARVKTAEAQYTQSLAELEQTRRNVQRLTRDAFSNVVANISQVRALHQGIISTKSSLEASQAGLEVGTRTTVDVLNTRRELFRAQRDHARARYDYILSTLRLKEASGSLQEEDLQKINKLLTE